MTKIARLPLLVLLPGLDGTGKLFAQFLHMLRDVDTQIIGYPTQVPLGYEALEALVRASLPTQRPYVLLGESFGGPIAIRIAAHPPAGLKAVILCGTFAQNPYAGFAWARYLAMWLPLKSLPRWIRAPLMWGTATTTGVPQGAARAIAEVAAPVVRQRIAALFTVDASDAAANIALPTLILTARRDRVIPRAATRRLLSLLPAAQSVDIAGPHLLLQTCPNECAAEVREFLGGINARSSNPGND